MARYIDADALEQHKFVSWTMPEFFNEKSLEQQAYQLGWNNAIEAIMENEPTADVVEVVRCRDCKYGEVDDMDFPTQIFCRYNGNDWNEDNHYCSYGERREDDKGRNTTSV